jgi:serine/threonine protein kinase
VSEPSNPEVEILNAALELSEPDRSAYLGKACAGDAALRQRVEELIQAHEQAEHFLDAPPAGSDYTRTKTAIIPLTEKPGDRIGRYKLLQQIGEGGCGVVYMAEQEEPVRRRVALKVIKLGMDTKSVIARFEAERQALALMDHPNIAKVLDAGATETGRPYFVMELVRGIKITDYCDENKVSTEERLKLFIQVCQAVQHAHQKGIIHRDIKPSNILVTVNDGVPVPKVIDFGIAKATQGRLTDKTLFTAFEQFIGTPAYMSPEQAVMTSLDIDTRSDIYSLGVLLYELLTGKTPFDANELLESGLDAMRRTIREIEPQKPSTRLITMLDVERTTTAKHRQTDPPKLIHLVRGDLDWIVMKSLEKDRTRRYETANGLAADIQRHLKCEPVVACPPSRLYEFQKTVRRHKFGFAAGAAVIAVLSIGVIVSTSQAIRAIHAEREQTHLRQQAESEGKKAKTEAAKSEQIARFLKSTLYGASPYSTVSSDSDRTALLEIVDRAAVRIGQDLKGQPEVEAELRQILGTTYSGISEWEKAEAMIREALRLRILVFGKTNKFVAESLDQLAFVLCNGNKPVEAEAIGRQALAMNRKLFGDESIDVAGSFDVLADLLGRQPAGLIEAEGLGRKALALFRKLEGNDHPDTAWALFIMARILNDRGKSAEAESLARESLALYRKLYGEENAYVFLPKDVLATVLWHEGKLAEAETLYREALTRHRKTLGSQPAAMSALLQSMGDLLAAEGKLDEAESSFREALAIRRPAFGNENLDTAGTIHNLADVLRREGKLGEAETLYRETLAIRRKLLGNEDANTIASLRSLAEMLLKAGRQDEAKALIDAQSAPTVKGNLESH